MINAKTQICMVIGDPVAHSLSPLLHNTGYLSLGIDDCFVYLGGRIQIDKLKFFLDSMKLLNIRGVSATMPHKVEVLKLLDEVDPVAKEIGAANTVVNNSGRLTGYNTDWMGIVLPLKEKIRLKNRRVAVLGAGGAARAAVYGLVREGCEVTVFNRTYKNAKQLAEKFGAFPASPDEIKEISKMDIIINTTPLGMAPDVEQTPLDKELISERHLVFDLVYHPQQTRLLKDALEKGAKTIDGTEMLLAQAVGQFELFTGLKAPINKMREALGKAVKDEN